LANKKNQPLVGRGGERGKTPEEKGNEKKQQEKRARKKKRHSWGDRRFQTAEPEEKGASNTRTRGEPVEKKEQEKARRLKLTAAISEWKKEESP